MTATVPIKPIAAVQGADSASIQLLFGKVADAPWCPPRLTGVIEQTRERASGACGPGHLQTIGIGRGDSYRLFQELGPGSASCSLHPEGVTDACEAVCRNIAAGCDLVILSKFGKLEAESGAGLMPAFIAALEAGVPVLTSVSPRFSEQWQAFAAPYFEMIDADLRQIGDWWARQGA